MTMRTGQSGRVAVGALLFSLALFALEASAQPGPAGSVPPQLPPQAADKAKEAVQAQTASTVSLTAPAMGSLYTAPATVLLQATASASSSGKSIAQVEFFAGTTLIGTASSAPYSFNWTPVAAGAYSLTARATDNLGAAATSTAVAITVNAPPTVSLTSPGNATVFNAPATIPVTAAAEDPDGTIARVEFYNGTSLIAALTAAPYSINWLQVPPGSYSLSARVTDNLGTTTASTAVTVTVNAALAQIYYIHTDHLNTPRAIYDQQQRLVWRWDQSDPFGGNPPDENPSGLGNFTCNLRLPGQYFDKETNLHYNYFRDYDPGIGRYIQSDPVGLDGGINAYAYASNNPVSLIDPDGLLGRAPGTFGKGGAGNIPGNVWGTFIPQDLTCSFPIPNLNPCVTNCCMAHDQCFDKYKCNWTSWIGNLFGTRFKCQKCNSEGSSCIWKVISQCEIPPCIPPSLPIMAP